MSIKKLSPNHRFGIETRTVHNGRDPASQGGMINAPIYHGSTVVFPTLADLEQSRLDHDLKDKVVYGRLGNPSTFAFENAVADLENGYGSVSVSSGMAAVTTTILAFAGSGDHVLMVDSAYGPTRSFCDNYLNRMGVEVSYYDPMVGAGIEDLVKANTKLIFMESPGSITFEVQDVPEIVSVARKHNITTALDNSWATPLYYRPLDFGVNVSVTAGTKYIAGHADAMIGLITTDEESFYVVKRCRDLLGQSLAPDDVYLGTRGIRTLSVRVKQHEQQGLALAKWLQSHSEVLKIIHPAIQGCPGHAVWKRDFSGSSGLFSFIIKPRSRHALANLLDHMELFSMGYSWGGYESLIVPQEPAKSRTATTWENPGQLIRVHAGLENIEDLIADMEAGLSRYAAS
ncbi:MAG: cystathionine beta-lyase [bacterium]